MNETSDNIDRDTPESTLDAAIWAVAGNSLPGDAIERVKQRAKALATQSDDGAALPETGSLDEFVAADATASDATISKPSDSISQKKTRRSAWLRMLAPVATAAVVIAVVSSALFRPSVSLAQVLSQTIKAKWIHGTTTVTTLQKDAPQPTGVAVTMESWASAEAGIQAVRMPRQIIFENHQTQEAFRYAVGSDAVFKTLPIDQDMRPIKPGANVLNQLMALQKDGAEATGFKISDIKSQKTMSNGASVVEYRYRMTRPGTDRYHDVLLVVEADSQLLLTMEEQHSSGLRTHTVFDYPDSGPTDVYAIGVPRDTEVIDRIASSDVQKIAADWSKARVDFDDYDLISVQVPEGLNSSVVTGLNASIKRVRRKGQLYRVDMLLKAKDSLEPPEPNENMDEWWAANRDQYWSVPMLICDGSKIVTYKMVSSRIGKGKPNLAVRIRSEHPVNGVGEDRPVSWPHLMPEYACRPHLWTTIPDRQFEFEPIPEDGPDGSVRLVVSKPDAFVSPERHRYWMNAEKDCVVTNVVQPVFRDHGAEVAYIDQEVHSDFRQSPSGFWYPTKTVRTAGESARSQIRTFHVTFTGTLDETLFDPAHVQPAK